MGKIKNLIGRLGLKIVKLTGHDDPDVLHRYRHYEDIIKGEKESIARLESSVDYYKSILQARSLNRNIVFVSHDANPGGAQMLSINIIRQLTEVFKFNVHVIVKAWGGLLDDYSKYAKSIICIETDIKDDADFKKWVSQTEAKIAMCNTTVTGDILKNLADAGFTCISMIHEMKNTIRELECENELKSIINHAQNVVFPSKYVSDSISEIIPIPENKAIILPQGIYKKEVAVKSSKECRSEIINRFNLPKDCSIVLNVGFVDHRKGVDLFAKCATHVCSELTNCIFLWVGASMGGTVESALEIVKGTAAEGKVVFAGLCDEMYPFYLACDMFLLTSREDPFPSVVMEAMSYSKPVVAFDGGGGYVELVSHEETGFLAQMENVEQMSSYVTKLLQDNDLRVNLGKQGQGRVKDISHFNSYVGKLLSLLGEKYEPVSAIITDCNCAHSLKESIDSVLAQTYPVNEVVILYDASANDSLSILKSYEKRYPLRIKAAVNEKNSEIVLSQRERVLKEATSRYIWIAEADDRKDPMFLQSLMETMVAGDEIGECRLFVPKDY